MDFNGDGQISEDEFIMFWKIVKGHGHTEEEIKEELTNIKNGDLWVGFDKVPVIHNNKNSKDWMMNAFLRFLKFYFMFVLWRLITQTNFLKSQKAHLETATTVNR